ncbi:hypothetical protein DAPPUDRAFT_99952 [Daphnia pulex]|uniref:Uncharacterized protein n=1 Tax=Daphnia pulex TaxID=6669 RepID=E9G8U6_DAPPU|nr:hypothetical protein DAPPUDRAFT_99952 [Daphnia pulex]|eukprot:EFX84210.1 hypothetical protein DAPPUDRAFT_99952 [Daphnia pulex]
MEFYGPVVELSTGHRRMIEFTAKANRNKKPTGFGQAVVGLFLSPPWPFCSSGTPLDGIDPSQVVGHHLWAAVDDLAVKTFSAGSVALQVNLGRGLINSAYDIHTIQDPEEKALAQRRLDCRKHLLEMRSRNADLMDPESGGQTVMQQEDLQEWLDNLHLKLKQACSGVSTPATGSSGNTMGPPARPARPSRRSVAAIAVAATAQSKSSTAFHLPLPLGSTLPVPPPSFSYSLLPPPSPASSSSGGSSGGSADPSIIQ